MLRDVLIPRAPDPDVLKKLADVIRRIEDAFEIGDPTDQLLEEHNRLANRDDIQAIRYQQLYASMSCEEAAFEALMPIATKVPDITRAELEDIANRILNPDNHDETSYYLALFEKNTPNGNSDLFFWPDETWLRELNTQEPTAAQIVERALAK